MLAAAQSSSSSGIYLILAVIIVAVLLLRWRRKKNRRLQEAETQRLASERLRNRIFLCTYLGGSESTALAEDSEYWVRFGLSSMDISDLHTRLIGSCPIDSVLDVQVSGRGQYTSGGGFIGGGFGSVGSIATGMVFSHILNDLTTRTHMDTLMFIQTDRGSFYFGTEQLSPRELIIKLAPFTEAMRRRKTRKEVN